MIFVPRDYQRALRDFALDIPRVNLWAGTGTGKTGSALEIVAHGLLFGEIEHVLVVSTKRIASMVWSSEIAKWENFSHLTCAVAVGTPQQRMDAIRRKCVITTINYDNLPWLIETVGEHWYWDTVIADESTRLKSLRIDIRTSSLGKTFARRSGGGKRAFDFAKVAHKKVRRWLNMSGTPAPKGLQDLWGPQWYIDAGARLGRSYTAFSLRWFRTVPIGDGSISTRIEPFPHSETEIKQLLRDCTITIDAADYFDLPPLVTNIVPITLPPAAVNQYRQMERDFFVEIKGHEIEAVSAASKAMKLRQFTSGAAYTQPDSSEWVNVHDAKIEACIDIINELAGASVLIAYQFKSDRARLLKAIPGSRYFDDNPQTLKDFIAGRFPVMLIHPASGGHGIDGMQTICSNIVFFSQTWNLEEELQVIERIGPTRQAQSGFNRPVYVHHLIVPNSIDEDMREGAEKKASIQEVIKSAMKKRG